MHILVRSIPPGLNEDRSNFSIVRFMGSLSNNSRKLANFAGFYKGIQSVGQAITWR